MSLPQLSFQMMLKKTKVRLELLTNIDQILLVEKGIRGGNSFVSQRHAKVTSNEEIAYIDGKSFYEKNENLLSKYLFFSKQLTTYMD